MSLIYQGDGFTQLARPNRLNAGESIDGNWSCLMGLYSQGGIELIAPTAVSAIGAHTDGEEYFIVSLSSADTEVLSPGKYILAIEISNNAISPAYNKETQEPLTVLAQLIA